MKVLVIYESLEGQTRKIAEFVQQQIRDAGHDVQVFDTADRLDVMSFGGVDRVILAAPVHERRHPESFEVFVATSLDDLKARPTLVLSVSLKAAFPEGLEEAQDYLTEMEMRTGLEPTSRLLVAGAVRTSSYGYFENQIVKNVALAGHDVDLVDGAREFTDWVAVAARIEDFLNAAQ